MTAIALFRRVFFISMSVTATAVHFKKNTNKKNNTENETTCTREFI